MIAMQPYVRVFRSAFGFISRYFVRPERMASMYFALSSLAADECLYVRSLPNSFSHRREVVRGLHPVARGLGLHRLVGGDPRRPPASSMGGSPPLDR
jgi:hypothetical protein